MDSKHVNERRETSGRKAGAKDKPSRGQTWTSDRSVDSSIGYGSPPKHSRFQLGMSGNPNGRPKKSRNLKTIIQHALTASVIVREGENKRHVSKLEGIVLRQVESALKGDGKAALAALKMAAQVGLLDNSSEANEGPNLSAGEQEMLEELLALGSAKPIKNKKK
jgi:Family of unknown function (DUF5681)